MPSSLPCQRCGLATNLPRTVSGRSTCCEHDVPTTTPWPRLRMWPRGPAFWSTSLTAASMPAGSANRITGSTLPCIPPERNQDDWRETALPPLSRLSACSTAFIATSRVERCDRATVTSQDSRLGIKHGTLSPAKPWPVQNLRCHDIDAARPRSIHEMQFVWFGGHLHGLVGAQPPPRVRHVDGPVQADDVGAGGAHALQQPPAAVGVQRDGRLRVPRLHRPDDVLQVRPGPLVPLLQGGSPWRGQRLLAHFFAYVLRQCPGCILNIQVGSPKAGADRPMSRKAALHQHLPLSAASHRGNVTQGHWCRHVLRHPEQDSCCHAWVLDPDRPRVLPCLEAHVLGDLDGQVLQQR